MNECINKTLTEKELNLIINYDKINFNNFLKSLQKNTILTKIYFESYHFGYKRIIDIINILQTKTSLKKVFIIIRKKFKTKYFKENRLINYHMKYINELNKLENVKFILKVYRPYIINKNINS